MAGQEFKAKNKEVLQMTRDGAVQKNLADDTEKRISQRDEDYDLRSEESAGDLPPIPFPRISTPKQNLGEFTHRKIRKQRKRDILTEKHEATLDKASHESENLQNDLISDKKSVYAKRSVVIKSEYGGICEYNKVNTAIQSDKYRSDLIGEKKGLLKARSDIIKSEYGSIAEYNKSRKTDGFKKSEQLEAIEKKCSDIDKKIHFESAKLEKFYTSRSFEDLKVCNSRKDFKSLQKSVLQKSERLSVLEAKYSDLGGKISHESAKIKAFSAEKKEITAERSSLKSVRVTDKAKVDSYKSKLKFEKSEGGKSEIKAARADYRLAKAQKKLPQHRIVRKTYVFDEKSGKVKRKLKIEKEIKPVNGRGGIVSDGIKKSTSTLTSAAVVGIHRQISKYEEDNSALKAAHGAEKVAEKSVRSGIRTVKAANKHIKEVPYKKASRLKFQSEKANRKLTFNKAVSKNQEVIKGTETAKKAARKSMMKRNARQLQKSAGNTAQKAVTKLAKKAQEILLKNKYVLIGIVIILLAVCIFSSLFGSFAMMFSENTGAIIASTYMSEDGDMRAAEDYIKSLENGLQGTLNNIPNMYKGWDEYRYSLDSIGHDPYALISYLSAKYIVFQYGTEIQGDIQALFNALYSIQLRAVLEERRIEYPPKHTYFHAMEIGNRLEWNGGYYEITHIGEPYEEVYNWDVVLLDLNVPEPTYLNTTAYDIYAAGYAITYDWYVLQTTLIKRDFDTAVKSLLVSDMYNLYALLLETKGNRPDLFP